MVTVVVIINMLISLMLFYVAWRVWQLKRRLVKIADTLTAAERSTHAVLHRAPNAIYKGQQNVHNLRQTNQALEQQIQQVRQIFRLLIFGQQVWLRYFQKFRSKS